MNTFTVKPLAWQESRGDRRAYALCNYFISRHEGKICLMIESSPMNYLPRVGPFKDYDAAKAAAQKHHEEHLAKWLKPAQGDQP